MKRVSSQKEAEQNMRLAMELRDELFDLANSLAGDTYGAAACCLHSACNYIARAGAIVKPSILGLDAPYCAENFDR